LQTLEGHSGSAFSVAFSPDGRQVVSGSIDEMVQLWDAAAGAALYTLEGHLSSVKSVAFSPDGRRVVSGSNDETVRLWDAATGAALHTLKGYSDWVNSVAFSPDGGRVVSGSDDKTVRLWDAATGAALQTLDGNSDSVSPIAQGGTIPHTLFVSNNWVAEVGSNLVWLPPAYRATCEAVWNKIIVLGHPSGRISILGFKEG
jgi:WD40 repeat protein